MMNNLSIKQIYQNFLQCNTALLNSFHTKNDWQVFFANKCQLYDETISFLYNHFITSNNACLLATGGFGRRELYPFSDTDFSIIFANQISDKERSDIESLIQTMWDWKFSPSPKVGSISELLLSAQNDLTGDTAFLESRFLCGNQSIAESFLNQLNQQRNISTFIDGKISELINRHNHSQGSGSLLEPNIKTCPGGLRDIHTLIWLAKVQHLPDNFHALVGRGIITRREATLLMRSYQTLARIRMYLHHVAGRAEERLLFDYQNKIAEMLNLYDDSTTLKSEKLMKMFYRASKSVKQLDGILLPMLKNRVSGEATTIKHINDDYEQRGNLLAVRDNNLFKRKNSHIFHLIRLFQENKDLVGIEPHTLRLWWDEAQKIERHFRRIPENRRLFIEIFRNQSRLTQILRILNLYGVLGKYLPAFDRIIGLLQHDLFHIYPVDDHILTVVRNLRRMSKEEYAHELPFASALMHNFERKDILYLAAFFHDISKGRGGNHELLGAIEAEKFAKEHFLNKEESDLLIWLVKNHLLLSLTSQKEDINNIEIIANFCQIVDTPEKLTALYLLTVADVRGTNPVIWNSWKAGLFKQFFQSALEYLNGKSPDKSVIVEHRRQLALSIINDIPTAKKLPLQLGDAYFVRHEADEIVWHMNEIAHTSTEPHIAITCHNDGLFKVMVYLPNRARLFASLCRLFGYLLLDIVQARAYLTEHGFILDTFYLYAPSQFNSEDYNRIKGDLQNGLQLLMEKNIEINYKKIPFNQSRRTRHLPIVPQISFSEDEEDIGCFTLQIVVGNRRGLLADIAETLSDFGIDIRHAKINTLDERVEDSFLIYAPMLTDLNKQTSLKKALLEAMTNP